MNKHTHETQPLLRERQQIFGVGFVLWLALAAWTLSAFWEHINSLKPEYALQSRLGACGGEFLALAFLWWHCFHVKLGVRKWALIHSALMACVLLFHSGGVRGLKEAQHQQVEAEERLTANLGQLSKSQTAAAGEAAGKLRAAGGSSKEAGRLGAGIARDANQAAAQNVRQLTEAGTEKVQNSTLLPAWYWRDWAYSAIFIAAVLLFVHLCWVMLTDTRVDRNFDGIDDAKQSAPTATTPAAGGQGEQPDPKA